MPKKVMIADDDPGIVDFVSIALEMEGFEVSSTYNGATLLELQENLPDIFLLDIWMSGSDGRDICRQLKQKDATRHIPVIMISASKDIAKSAIDSGADNFLAKPFELDELISIVTQYAAE